MFHGEKPTFVETEDNLKAFMRMKNTYYLAVDLGATSGRVVLSSFDGGRVEMRELARFRNPMIPMNGHLFWDLPMLYYEILQGLRKAAAEHIEITSIGIDSWGCDFALFAADGRLAGLPYCYRDSHTEGAMEKFFASVPSRRLYELTGIQFMNFNSLFQLDTLRRNGCSGMAVADKILFIPDALSYMLTGRAVTEYTVASTSQMLNPRTGDLEPELLKAVGIARGRFGKMVRPGTLVGKLTEQVRQYTGLPDVPVIAVAGHDTASAVVAVPASDEHFAYLSCGTWSLLGIETPHPIITDDSFRMNFTNEGGVDGTTRFLKNICGLWLFERCREEFPDTVCKDVATLAALCETSDYDGLICPDSPCFASPVSMTQAIVDYCRHTGQVPPQSPADYIRCIYRSLALRYRQVLGWLLDVSPFELKCLHVIGGGSKNKFLMQYTADATGMPVVCGPVEGTALGNTLVQVRASGGVGTLADMRRISAASVELERYTPCPSEEWERAYGRFLDIQKQEEH